MMNRPRPRKLINVIKASPSTEETAEIQEKSEFISQSPCQNKPASPIVPLYSNNNMLPSSSDSTASSSNFITSKPIVTTLKKATVVPPPPTFSDSPKSILAMGHEQGQAPEKLQSSNNRLPIQFSKTTEPIQNTHINMPTQTTEPTKPIPFSQPTQHTNPSQTTQSTPSSVLSPKSSGEAFLDAADKAADFIGGAFLNSFNRFNLSDRSTVKFKDSEKERDDDPFADIMKKLKSPVQESERSKPAVQAVQDSFANLMDEQPPQSFNDKFKTEDEGVRGIKKPMKRAEPSSFIKAAFSPKEHSSLTEEVKKVSMSNGLVSEPEYTESIVSQSSEYIATKSTESLAESILSESYNLKSKSYKPTDCDVTDSTESTVIENMESIVSEPTDTYVVEPIEYNRTEYIETVHTETLSLETEAYDILESYISESSKSTVSDSSLHSLSSVATDVESVYEPQIYCSSPDISVASSNNPIAIPFFDSISSNNSNSISSNSISSTYSIKSDVPASPRTGFRASILKHGLSALEKIGKSTADAVVSTRNKLANNEQMMMPSMNSQTITPDYSDESATFYEVLKLYGGYSKLQELQLRGVKASIASKLARKNEKTSRFCTFDHQMRLKQQREISSLLHPDRIMECIDTKSDGQYPILASVSDDSDEIICIQKLLKSLDNIVIIDPQVLVPSNKRRHVICQVATVFCTLLLKCRYDPNNSLSLAKEVSIFTAQIIKYLQTNFDLNCESNNSAFRADRDQQVAIKLFLDISYSIVPQLQ